MWYRGYIVKSNRFISFYNLYRLGQCFVISLLLTACEDVIAERKLPYHPIHQMAKSGKLYVGYHPFTDPKIDKVCVLGGHLDLSKYHRQINKDIPVYELIRVVVSTGDTDKAYLLHSLLINNNTNLYYCTFQPQKLVIKTSDYGGWVLKMEKK